MRRAADVLTHPRVREGDDRPAGDGRLSTVGHARAFRAFARAMRRMKATFMVIGGTYRDVAIRAASTRDIDVVVIDRDDLDEAIMTAAGFDRVPRHRYAWRFHAGERIVDLEVAALASSTDARGPFSVAFREGVTAVIEGVPVRVPRREDYVVLKLFAAAADARRRARDLLDVRWALDGAPERVRRGALSVPAIRRRLRTLYDLDPAQANVLTALYRAARRSV